MLSMEEREQIAQRLEQLSLELQPHIGEIVRDLPELLQQKIRREKSLTPITSSGLERIASVYNRIRWAIIFMRDPEFTGEEPIAPTPPSPRPSIEKKATSIPISRPSATPPSTTPPTHSTDELDFGPFDPRKSRQS